MASDLPVGTVTFLYTDIEESTRRWEQCPDDMRAAVERHDAILRRAIKAHSGVVFRTMGDAFCAVFTGPSDALLATIAAQRALVAEPWGEETGPLRVRMALHTGTGEVRDGDYVGPPLNRIARLLATGYGGQTLLSKTTYNLVHDLLPEGVTLSDLGEHRLKDLQHPEHVYQLVAPDLPGQFPPLNSLSTRANNLPVQMTPLVGREDDLEAVLALLTRTDVRLVTLTGPGGTGKTRLALRVAESLLDNFRDGVFYTPLAAITDHGLVLSMVAQTLGLKETVGQSIAAALRDFLKEKQMLLLLDNFEQVVDAAPEVAALLSAAPSLKVVVTSRAALRLSGEHEFEVPPLRLPDPKRLPPLAELAQNEAVSLFVQRCQAVSPDFALTDDNAAAVANICVRLDGLPLAIELAAARIKLLSPQAMLSRLNNRLKLLTGGARDLPTRQQTLQAAIAWSHDLLEAPDQVLFRRLAVFVGGCTLESGEAVCQGPGVRDQGSEVSDSNQIRNTQYAVDPTPDILDGTESLVNKSLLRQSEIPGGEVRFSMLETIREFALGKLAESGEEEAVRRAHAFYFLRLVEEAEPHLMGARQVEWLDRLEAEQENLRAALEWSQSPRGDTEVALRISGALLWYWQTRGYLGEVRERLGALLARPEASERTEARSKALLVSGRLATHQGDFASARSAFAENLEIRRELAEPLGIAHALIALGSAFTSLGEYAAARALYTESLEILERGHATPYKAMALVGLGEATLYSGDSEGAKPLLEESLELFRSGGNKGGAAFALALLGLLAYGKADYEAATRLFEESLALRRELGSKQAIAQSLLGLAELANTRGDAQRAATILGAIPTLLDDAGARMAPTDEARYRRNLDAARARLDNTGWETVWEEGHAMPVDQVIDYALGA